MQTEQTIDLAEKLLSETLGQPISLQPHPALESENVVLRCDVLGYDGGLSQVIVKRMVLDGVEEKRQTWLAKRFLNECASLKFLNTLPEKYTARWIASHVEKRLLIVEDLGKYPSVQDVLLTGDAQTATQALFTYAVALGQFQAATVGKEREFKSIQAELGAVTPFTDGNYDLREGMPSLRDCLDVLQVTPEDNFEAEVLSVAAAIHDSLVFRTLCHCDAGMHNVLWMSDGSVRLLDFEFAQYQHALVDIVCARMAFPPAYHGYPVPPTIVTQMENTYRAELAKGVAAANDDQLFYNGLVQACAHWVLTELAGLWRVYLQPRLQQGETYDSQEGRTPEKMLTLRRRLITYLRAFVAVAEEYDRQPATCITLTRVSDALLCHWETLEPLPYFPVFVEVTK